MQTSTRAKLDYIVATMAIEKQAPSPEAVSLCAGMAEGTVSMEEAMKQIYEKYNLKRNPGHGR